MHAPNLRMKADFPVALTADCLGLHTASVGSIKIVSM